MDLLQTISPLWIALAVVFAALILRVLLRSKAPVIAGGWKGPFYINPADPALFVRKRWTWGRHGLGLGYTLNFGNRWSWLVLAVMVVLFLGPLWYVIDALQKVFTLPSN
jgi:hypothetical protein